jgi:hypothetical protein
MSKWLKSTTQKSWVASVSDRQIVIPQNETPDNRWLELGEDEFAEVSRLPVIASLIKANGIMVLNEEPAELRNSIPALQVTNNQLQADLAVAQEHIVQLEAQLKDATHIDIEAIKAEVRQQCEEEKKQALEALDAKASALLEEKDKEIAKLEKKLKKLGGEE